MSKDVLNQASIAAETVDDLGQTANRIRKHGMVSQQAGRLHQQEYRKSLSRSKEKANLPLMMKTDGDKT